MRDTAAGTSRGSMHCLIWAWSTEHVVADAPPTALLYVGARSMVFCVNPTRIWAHVSIIISKRAYKTRSVLQSATPLLSRLFQTGLGQPGCFDITVFRTTLRKLSGHLMARGTCFVDRGTIDGAARQRRVDKDRLRRSKDNMVNVKSEVSVMMGNAIGKSGR